MMQADTCAPHRECPGHRSCFTGKEHDTESGNDYFGARYYASTMGRFLSPDPLIMEPRRLLDPQQLNLYAYGRDNPLRYTDPTGLDVNLNCSQVSSDTCSLLDEENAPPSGFYAAVVERAAKMVKN